MVPEICDLIKEEAENLLLQKFLKSSIPDMKQFSRRHINIPAEEPAGSNAGTCESLRAASQPLHAYGVLPVLTGASTAIRYAGRFTDQFKHEFFEP